jgi:hypothetical protein
MPPPPGICAISTELGIRRAGPADTPVVSSLLAAALMDTHVATWLVPDRREWVHIYRAYFALVTPWFVEHGTVYLTDDGGAAATWTSVEHGLFASDIADYDTRLARACGTATGRFVHDLAMHDAHPGEVPHGRRRPAGATPHLVPARKGYLPGHPRRCRRYRCRPDTAQETHGRTSSS